MEIRYRVEPKDFDRQFSKRLEGLNRELSNFEELFFRIATYLEEKAEESFELEGRGDKWPPTKSGGKILQKSGRLKDSFRLGSADNIFEIDGNQMRYGSKVPYGKYHQSKEPRETKEGGGPRLPRRAILEYLDEDKTNLQGILSTWAMEQKRKAMEED